MNHKISTDLRLSEKEVKASIKKLRTLGVPVSVDFRTHCHRCGVRARIQGIKYCIWCYWHVRWCMNRDEYLEPPVWPRRAADHCQEEGGAGTW